MIVAPQPEATEAGAEILKAGGNAVDSAIACALVQGVVDPMMCGIAGFGSCGIAIRGGFHGYIEFPGEFSASWNGRDTRSCAARGHTALRRCTPSVCIGTAWTAARTLATTAS